MTYEYKKIIIDVHSASWEEKMNELGKEGWECFHVEGAIFFMKKAVSNEDADTAKALHGIATSKQSDVADEQPIKHAGIVTDAIVNTIDKIQAQTKKGKK